MSKAAATTTTKTLRQGSGYESDKNTQAEQQEMHGGEKLEESSF